MKIGLFVDAFYPMIDGVINVVDNFAKELSNYADVTVFCPLKKGAIITDKPYKIVGCKCASLPYLDYPIPIPFFDKKFIKTLKDYKLDVLHVHSPFNLCKMGIKYAKKHKVPIVGTIHSQYKKDFKKALKFNFATNIATSLVVSFYNSCDVCFTVNEGMKNIYQNELKLKAPCHILPNATSHKPVENLQNAANQINSLYNLEDSELILLYVGRITFQKNLEFILEALYILKEKGVKYKMLFVGSGCDEKKLKNKICELNLNDRVILCGKITDVDLLQKIYARAKLLLFPSLYDANSLVQIESACQKTPALFLEGATTACQITKDVNGFLSSQTPTAYAKEIIRIIKDDNLYNKVCEGCFNDLYFTWEKTVKSAYHKYKQLIEEKSKYKNV